MPYVMRIVIAGQVMEVRKMMTGRVHSEHIQRAVRTGSTSEAQKRVNERRMEDELRWLMNANFTYQDLHLALHYYDKQTPLEQAEQDKRLFLKLLRKRCKKLEIEWKFIAVTETQNKKNLHHHILLPPIPMEILQEIWEKVLSGRLGNISIKPLDRRGNHAKMAKYFLKESAKVAEMWAELGKKHKRWTSARGMVRPEPKYEIVAASSWRADPAPRKGWALLKDDDGETVRRGIHDITGWPWMEYAMLRLTPEPPPAEKQNPKRPRP